MSKLYSELYKQAQVSLARLLEGEEQEIIRIYGTALSEIRDKLDALYKKHAKDGKLSNAELGKYNRLLGEQDQIQAILERRMKKVDSLTLRLTKEQYQASFYRHAYAIDQAGGMALEWGQIPEEAVEAAVNSTYSKLASSKAMMLSRTGTVEKVRQEISLATVRGDSYAVLANRISDALGVRVVGKHVEYIDKGAAARSLMVARTEGQRVLVDGQLAATRKAEELGCDIETIWDATLDSRTRPAHGALDGKPKDDSEKGWNVPGIGWVSAPLHSGVASFDINCRCRMRDQVKGYPPKERYVRGDGIKPYQTYEEWKLEHQPDFKIGKSLSAATKNYPVLLPDGNHGKFAEGTAITKVKIIAGNGTSVQIRDKLRLESTYHIPAAEWQKARGDGYVMENRKKLHAELHWYQARGERIEIKVKRYIDES